MLPQAPHPGPWSAAADNRPRSGDPSKISAAVVAVSLPVRICLAYDCLFPYTVGGAERWYRSLAERLAADGHEVTYLTLRQWERGAELDLDPRVRVVTAGPRLALYTKSGRR